MEKEKKKDKKNISDTHLKTKNIYIFFGMANFRYAFI